MIILYVCHEHKSDSKTINWLPILIDRSPAFIYVYFESHAQCSLFSYIHDTLFKYMTTMCNLISFYVHWFTFTHTYIRDAHEFLWLLLSMLSLKRRLFVIGDSFCWFGSVVFKVHTINDITSTYIIQIYGD